MSDRFGHKNWKPETAFPVKVVNQYRPKIGINVALNAGKTTRLANIYGAVLPDDIAHVKIHNTSAANVLYIQFNIDTDGNSQDATSYPIAAGQDLEVYGDKEYLDEIGFYAVANVTFGVIISIARK